MTDTIIFVSLMNTEWLRMTLDKHLWELFLEIVSIVAALFKIDSDDLLEKILTSLDAGNLMAIFLESK